MMKFALSVALLIGTTLLGPLAASAASQTSSAKAAPPSSAARPKPEADPLAVDLASKDPARQEAALKKIRSTVAMQPEKMTILWAQSMLAGGRYQPADELSLAGILGQPYSLSRVQRFQEVRVRAMLAAGKKPEALAYAKGVYNVSPMQDTANAMALLAECLLAAYPDDPAMANRFRDEQMAGATMREGLGVRGEGIGKSEGATTLATSNQQPATAPSVLSGIKVDPKPYEQAIARCNGEGYNNCVARGNLLLLADRPAEAKAAFERAYAMAPEEELAAATENLARAMKAQDGSIGRANAWILSLRPGK